MKNLVYYNVSHGQSPVRIPDGNQCDVFDLVASCLHQKELPNHLRQTLASFKKGDIDPFGVEKSSKWESLMTAVIYCLSGKLPLRHEVLRGRQIIMALPAKLRTRDVVDKIAFTLLPYILIGFKSHLEERFQSDSNIVGDVVSFITRLSEIEDPLALSFLCAHRGRSVEERHVLIDSVQIPKALVTLNVIKGILANNPWSKSGHIRWYQQGPTEWACLNMFPEMFLRYLVQGKVSHLLTLLGRHFTDIQEMMGDIDPNGIKTELVEMDPLTSEVLNFLRRKYGDEWRSTDYSRVSVKKDPLVEIALDVALPSVARQMPFYSAKHSHREYLNRKESLIIQNIDDSPGLTQVRASLIRCTIERFFETQIMHPTAKALYETSFYYVWGKRSAQSRREVPIGIDRDHGWFQYLAWKEGYREGTTEAQNVPLLYARRTAEDCVGDALKDYSLRQFWR